MTTTTRQVLASILAATTLPFGMVAAAEVPVFEVQNQPVEKDQATKLFGVLSNGSKAIILKPGEDLGVKQPEMQELQRPQLQGQELQRQEQLQQLPEGTRKDLRLKQPELQELKRPDPKTLPEKETGKTDFQESKTLITLRDGKKVLEIDRRSGFYFLADMDRLWNHEVEPDLISEEAAIDRSRAFVETYELMPKGDFVTVSLTNVSGTFVGEDIPGRIDRRQIDTIVTFGMDLAIDGRQVPVVGGGAELSVSLGNGGAVISYQGGWRPITGIVDMVDVGEPEQAIESFLKNAGENKYDNVKAELAYYAAPGFREQEYLTPVWVVTADLIDENGIQPIRPQILAAAAQFPPPFRPATPSKERNLELKEKEPEKTRGDEEGKGRFGLLDLLIPPAHAQNGLECGASWIGESQGLGGSSGNRQGFIDGCRDLGWNINFDWGNESAFESDWRRNDDLYVDAADLVFYTGHAGPTSWNVFEPDDTRLSDSEVSGSLDMWGQNDLEWLIIAACGPLQSTHFTTNTTNAFDRWRDAMDGLHLFMGYGAVTFDNTEEGERFMELTRNGWNVMDAWFRTARDVQPATQDWEPPNGPDIFVVAMYAHNGDHCARNDHLWGTGSTCADVRGSGQRRHMFWSGT